MRARVCVCVSLSLSITIQFIVGTSFSSGLLKVSDLLLINLFSNSAYFFSVSLIHSFWRKKLVDAIKSLFHSRPITKAEFRARETHIHYNTCIQKQYEYGIFGSRLKVTLRA